MANEEFNKFSSNLKVPPLKIVLSSHQNNTVVNLGNIDESQSFKSNQKDNNINDHNEHGEFSRRNGSGNSESGDRHHKKGVKGTAERRDNESGHTSTRAAGFSSSSSSSSSSSDRSNSTTPSSESESLASNSTIISEHQHVKNKTDTKDDTTVVKTEKNSRVGSKVPAPEKVSSGSHNKRSHDGTAEQSNESTATSSRDHTLNANQRITRSSQRAAQQNKSENPLENSVDESAAPENQDKIHESARKVKRRKGEVQESEQDNAQSNAQLTVKMANIHPADYQLPSQNSFELYRDIRKRPYKKLLKLNHIQPKIPHGFKDYLLNGGPYLLDGNKLGVGLNGPKIDDINNGYPGRTKINLTGRVPLRMKMSNLFPKGSSQQSSYQRHSSYTVPKILEAPVTLQVGSPLYELFQDQEKARQQMRMQHLKERERAILASEQEILRAYNKAAIADVKQKLHLSACTYFYYQERYHYLNEKSGTNGETVSKEVPHSQDNSFLCIEGGENTKSNDAGSSTAKEAKSSPESEDKVKESEVKPVEDDKQPNNSTEFSTEDSKETNANNTSGKNGIETTSEVKLESNVSGVEKTDSSKDNQKDAQLEAVEPKLGAVEGFGGESRNSADTVETQEPKEKQDVDTGKNDERVKNLDADSDNSLSELPNDKVEAVKETSDEDLKILNEGVFIAQLQEIDDKWDNIKKDMWVRHKNEADSLYAVQTLEWEWKAKEIGACDVRVSLRVEPEFVPRVEVMALDY